MAEKEAIIFVVDVGKSMGQQRNGRSISDLDFSLQYVWDRATAVVALGRKTVFVGVIGLGTDDTRNSMSEDDSYRHISVLQDLRPMGMNEIRELTPRLKPSNTNDRDAMSALILAIDMIMRHCRTLQFKKKIYLVTNATGPVDPDDIDTVVEQIKQHNINLTVLGVDFDDADYGFKEEEKSHTKQKNERLLRRLVDESGGVFGTMQEAIDGLIIPHIKPVRPTPTYKGQLRLGDPNNFDTAITIDIERYFKVSVRRPPTASSFVPRSDTTEQEALAPVENSRNYIIHDETAPENERAVNREELAKGYQYGRTAVPISESDENVTRLETSSGYEILGFISRENVERYMVFDNTNMLIGQKSNPKAELAISSLIHALFEIDSCAIARLVKKDMTEPFLTLLTPYADNEIECLIENMIPFAEDLRQYRFPPLDKILAVSGNPFERHRNLPDNNLMDAMDKFVDDMTLEDTDQLRIEDIYSPVLHSIEGAIKYRAVHPDAGLPAIADFFMSPSRQPDNLRDQSRTSLRRLINTSDVKQVPPMVKSRKQHCEPENPVSGLNVADLFRKEGRTKISPDNVIPEFKRLANTAENMDEIYDAVKQIEKIVEDRIRESFGDSNYNRVIEELSVLRHELEELEEANAWNNVIRDLKQRILSESLGGSRRELWWRMRHARLGLLVCRNQKGADVADEDVQQFFTSK